MDDNIYIFALSIHSSCVKLSGWVVVLLLTGLVALLALLYHFCGDLEGRRAIKFAGFALDVHMLGRVDHSEVHSELSRLEETVLDDLDESDG